MVILTPLALMLDINYKGHIRQTCAWIEYSGPDNSRKHAESIRGRTSHACNDQPASAAVLSAI